MMKPKSNGLIELHDATQKESGFFCIKLVCHLNNEAQMGTEEYERLWHHRFNQAKAGVCHYREQCSIYARTIEKQKVNQ